MKRLDELGISHAPWKCATDDNGEIIGIENRCGFYVGRFAVDVKPNDASLIAAAPKLYGALREAVKSYCEGCNDFVNEDQRCDPSECPARKWRAVLAEAAGDGGEA